MVLGARDDPYLGFRFRVEIESLIVAGFSEVSGLEVDLQTEDYHEGGKNQSVHVFPTRVEQGTLTLRRGLTGSRDLWAWMVDATDGWPERKNVRIFLLDSTGAPSRGWECREAFPVRWAGPDLQADQSDVAVEELELAHGGVSELGGL